MLATPTTEVHLNSVQLWEWSDFFQEYHFSGCCQYTTYTSSFNSIKLQCLWVLIDGFSINVYISITLYVYKFITYNVYTYIRAHIFVYCMYVRMIKGSIEYVYNFILCNLKLLICYCSCCVSWFVLIWYSICAIHVFLNGRIYTL